MQKEMPSAQSVLAPARRRLLRSLALGSVVVAAAVVVPGAGAQADEPDGSTVVGTLVQAWPDAEGGSHTDEGPISWVQAADGDAVRIPTADVEGIPTGTTVEVTVGSGDGAESADPLHEVLAAEIVAPAPPAPVLADAAGLTNQVTVVLVAPGGVARDGVTAQELVDVVDGPVADFWSEQSDGAISVGVTATHDWVSPVAGCSDPTAMWNEVAAAVGFVPGPGRHLMLYLSSAAQDCSYALAEVGSAPQSGGRLYVRDTVTSVIAHELGHNFGLGHSSARQCDAAVESAACRTSAYHDYYDVMGVSWEQLGSLNAAQAARLGVLPAAEQQSLTVGSGAATVTLAPLSGRTGTRGLRLTDADGVDYWLEYRTATARDGWLGTAADRYRLQSGVLLRRAENLPDTSVLLDGTPTAPAAWDRDLQSALPVGTPVPVSADDFSVVVQSVGAAGAVVQVTPAPGAGVAPAPRPAPPAPGTVMSGTVGEPQEAAPPAGDAARFWAPGYADGSLLRTSPALASAADSSNGTWLLVPLAGTVLAASVLLVVRSGRRKRARSF
jgi:hypothetical protein